ncbi:hypothetical protein [Benzoatithermus flavus]|uniref:Uncharacterized protein n=1 Tax=Benzoatithermus flavus TaxID=3108223 RepID=A0ABU8XN78_9PROT
MVREAARRCLKPALLSLLLGLLPAAPSFAADLCARLTIPATLGLVCVAAPDTAPEAVAVEPVDGAFAALSRMTVRPLDRGGDPLAWSDPAAWLQQQMTLDTSRYADLLGGLAKDPDSPFAGPAAEQALERLKSALTGIGRLALGACDEPSETAPGRWDMRCGFTPAGLGLLVHLRLVAEGERRWAMTMRAANERRLRHFEAIANTFAPPR